MQRDVDRATGLVGLIVAVNLLIGLVGYFVTFMFAYGFDDVSAANHYMFLMLIGVLAAVAAAISTVIIEALPRPYLEKSVKLAAGVSFAINLTAIGIGSIVSAMHKDQNSVSADFSTTTDIVVAVSLFAGAAIAGWLAWRALPTMDS